MVFPKMILRTVFLALSCACAAALTTLTAGDEECALYLSGPARTSAYDYSLNLLRGNFGYEGQNTCITYEAINQAYIEARKRILVAQPKGDWTPEDYASVGELVLDISTTISRRYGLTYEEIEKGLPLIDTSRTLIAEVCPPVFSHVECRAGKYRRLDGLCNNLEHPTWGSTNVPFQRLLGPLFADGINSPRVAHSGRDLPLSRVVSRTIHPDEGFHDHAGTVMVIAWGQFMDHDYTLTATPLDPRNRNDPEECCKRPPHTKHPYCNEIRIPDDDHFYRLFGVKCIDFVRAFPSPRPGCRLGSRIPYNTLTGVLDGNTVYGVTDKFARKLRTGYGGLLRMNDVFKEYGLRDLLPLKLDIPDEGCTRPNKNMYCFEAGEIRVNEQLVLTVMHTLMAREHNRVAKGLAEVNPHWDDETLYQEARRINIAEIQHITYNEFLPILLGKDVMEKFGLVVQKEGYWDGYDTNVNPDVIASFASAAYRFGHSLLPTAIERWSKAHKFIASKRLSDLIRRPYDLYRAGVLDEYIMGLMNQVAQAMDDSITQEVTNHLFKKVGARFGMDLVSFNMQRGREFGIPGYMEFRKFCGLPGADTFEGLFGSMPNATVQKYESIFEHPIDVDLWSGGVSERPLPGSMLGPTFACIIATQFSYSKRGDRFWYELPNQPSSFTPQQLKEVRKARMARVICDNTDIIDTVQLYPMVLPDHELNPRVPCRSGIIPSMDFSAWAEQPPLASPAKQFITDAIIENKTIVDWPKNHTANNETKCFGNDTHAESCNTLILKDSVAENNTKPTTEMNEAGNKNDTESKHIVQTDNVLKYVYKKNEKREKPKNIAHSQNSLKRRRRNVEDDTQSNEKPLIVNYQTSHSDKNTNRQLPLLQNYEIFPPAPQLEQLSSPRNTENYIKTSDLASFDIKTLHDHIKNPRFEDEEDSHNYKKSRDSEKSKQHDSKEDEDAAYNKSLDSEENNSPSAKTGKPFGKMYASFHPEAVTKPGSDEISSQNIHSYENSKENDDKSLSEDEKIKSNENSEGDDKDAYRKLLQYEATELESKKPDSEEKGINESSDYKHENHDLKQNSEEISNRSHQRKEEDNSSENDRSDSREVTDSEEYDKSPSDVASKENLKESPQKYSPYKHELAKTRGTNSYDSYEQQSKLKSGEKDDKQSYEVQEEQREPQVVRENSDEGDDVNELRTHKYKPINSESDYPILPPKYVSEKDTENENSAKDSGENDTNEKENYGFIEEQQSVKENQERGEEDVSNRPILYNDNLSNKENTSVSIQDVDLGDFSYERIKLDSDGKVISANDNNDKSEEGSFEHKSSDDKSSSVREDSSSQEGPHPVKINDGEIKPVIEIDNENDSESSENDSANEEEDLHDYKGKQIPFNSAETKDKLSDAIKSQPHGEKKSVKQEFERIPLNYNHDSNTNQDDNSNSKEKSEETNETPDRPVQENDEAPDDAPDDRPPLKNNNYDLNFRFKDPVVKLPEIKLPEDILTYNFDDYKPKKNKDTAKFYHYDDEKYSEDKEADPKQNEEDEDDHDYYHTKPNERQREAEEDEKEDLYEKFVRERFGKRGSFGKRSETLQELRHVPVNPELQHQIQKVLKRAEETGKQADKSGDPNAGFAWTLEYNHKL